MLTLWCVSDGKPGHHSQLSGLAGALAERQHCRVRWFETAHQPLRQAAGAGQPPDLILCAGHRTHRPSLQLKWRYGGKLVALMKPSLPRWLFDLCIVPRHDGLAPGPRVLLTEGTLTDIRYSPLRQAGRGLILLGGASRNHRWHNEHMLTQLNALLASTADCHWIMTTSRRTPASFARAAAALAPAHCQLVTADQTDRDWLRRQLAGAEQVWVSEDSASMVYEGLASGARVGILPVPRRRPSRVSRGLDQLVADQRVCTLVSLLQNTATAPVVAPPLRETERVARHLLSLLSHTWSLPSGESAPGFAPPR
ncbi:ELM1/GtrOC1 family putative glycosyltransferase [Parahaliea mediterranea]|uniref:ELM1/GtrOC1 family putative glycosyltransferase n=1 Tax=Parahaliea mediterranea TaxID=651086 RepID=UPI001F4E6D4E|nr:ELM1/GtrOC1 family putative glycosyltransferase [Parahaliea mediterranea]